MKNSKLKVGSPVVKPVVKAVESKSVLINAPVAEGVVKADLFKRYLELKKAEASVEAELKQLKEQFEEKGMSGFECDGRMLLKQEKNSVSYADDVKDYLKYKGVLDQCISFDKSKIEALAKVKILDTAELEKFKQTKTSYSWVVK